MIHFTLVVIIVQGAAPPVIQEQPIDQDAAIAIEPERGAINWHCPQCGWWNAYDSMASYRIGSKAHLRRCPKR